MIGWFTAAMAESWCAAPLYAHEWGVAWLVPEGGDVPKIANPTWFERTGKPGSTVDPVWSLPPDGGQRALPLLQFHGGWGAGPVAIELGFRDGPATEWFPPVQDFTPYDVTRSAESIAARQALLTQRATAGLGPVARGIDPTRQLHWSHLTMGGERKRAPLATDVAWVQQARGIDALWVDDGEHAERFVFYEGATLEKPDVVVEQGEQGPDHVILRNVGAHDVYDVVYMRGGKSFTVPRIPAGRFAGVLLEAVHEPPKVQAWLTKRWTTDARPPDGECVMMRKPAVPAEISIDHRLYVDEIALLWSVWAERILQPGDQTRLLYREAPASLDERVPLSVYTDMMSDPRLSRLGVVVVAL